MSQIGIDLLRSLISYNPETGEMLWLARPASMFDDGKQSAERSQAVWNGRFAGKSEPILPRVRRQKPAGLVSVSMASTLITAEQYE